MTETTQQLFSHLPLSEPTLKGLKSSNFLKMTPIQANALPITLEGKDILATARTGSGKTLCFVVTLLEKLYKQNWNPMDGVGALVISPTRELALQIFQVLRKVGRFHTFSAGLLVGGKDKDQEASRIGKINILIATPGRLLHHLDTTPNFSCDNLQVLILDEADRILDQGFKKTMDGIISALPPRQTLLFSATLSPSVLDLAKLSLKNPEQVSIQDTPPDDLVQRYMISPLDMKLDILFSFLRSHTKSKILCFLSSCKQVRFVFETFCKLQPGIPLMELHGKQKLPKRFAIFEAYSRKKAACLFATDIAARGLDFPAVDWVIQIDCPEDVSTYIHRVGRTARYDSQGNALLLLTPSETAFLEPLQQKIPVTPIEVNPKKTTSIKGQLASLCAQDPELRYLGQKAFISYLRSIHLQSNKQVFKVDELPIEAFAESLGLPGTPQIRFTKSKGKNVARNKAKVVLSDEEVPKEVVPVAPKPTTKIDKLFAKKNNTVLSQHYQKVVQAESESEDDIFTLTRKDHDIDGEFKGETNLTKRRLQKINKRAKMSRGLPTKFTFDEEGEAVPVHTLVPESAIDKSKIKEEQEAYLKSQAEKMRQEDVTDKQLARDKRREKILLKKQKQRAKQNGSQALLPTLGSVSGSDQSGSEGSPTIPPSPPRKRQKVTKPTTLEDQEKLALALLNQ